MNLKFMRALWLFRPASTGLNHMVIKYVAQGAFLMFPLYDYGNLKYIISVGIRLFIFNYIL